MACRSLLSGEGCPIQDMMHTASVGALGLERFSGFEDVAEEVGGWMLVPRMSEKDFYSNSDRRSRRVR